MIVRRLWSRVWERVAYVAGLAVTVGVTFAIAAGMFPVPVVVIGAFVVAIGYVVAMDWLFGLQVGRSLKFEVSAGSGDGCGGCGGCGG